MVTNCFEKNVPGIMGPGDFFGEKGHYCDICIATFSREIFEKTVKNPALGCRCIAEIRACNHHKKVYLMDVEGIPVALYLSELGSAMSANDIINVGWLTGATKFITFGSAGSLDSAATLGKYVVPSFAFRDEGLSYHYAPPADTIEIKNADFVASCFREWNIPFVTGGTWTTDAFYRETQAAMTRHKQAGCICVEMEVAGMQAVCDYYGFSLYNFLATGDTLDTPTYDISHLGKANHDNAKMELALRIAEKLQ